jgi:hypothetical protein
MGVIRPVVELKVTLQIGQYQKNGLKVIRT